MQFEDEVVVDSPREQVWTFLLDPYALGGCVPGVEEVEIFESGRAFGGIGRISFGSLEVKFPARVEWVEQDELRGGRLRALARVVGHEIEGEGTLNLTDEGAGTRLAWSASVLLPEALTENPFTAQMGQTVAVRFIKNFFECIQTRLANV